MDKYLAKYQKILNDNPYLIEEREHSFYPSSIESNKDMAVYEYNRINSIFHQKENEPIFDMDQDAMIQETLTIINDFIKIGEYYHALCYCVALQILMGIEVKSYSTIKTMISQNLNLKELLDVDRFTKNNKGNPNENDFGKGRNR